MQHIITDEEVNNYINVFTKHAGNANKSHKAALADFLNNRPESTLGKLRPIAEMPETAPEGCVRVTALMDADGSWCVSDCRVPSDTYAIDIELPTPDPEAEERQRFEEWYANNVPASCNFTKADFWALWKLAKAK